VKRGERTPEATRDYRKLQRHKRRYMELREELQLAGVLPVEPDGSLRNERVDPADQTAQALPALTGVAIRRGWAVPEEKKPLLVDELVSIMENPEESNRVKVAAFNALCQADQHEHERNNPKDGQFGTTTILNVVEVVVGGDGGDIPKAAAISKE
jgi:hypothetical protein